MSWQKLVKELWKFFIIFNVRIVKSGGVLATHQSKKWHSGVPGVEKKINSIKPSSRAYMYIDHIVLSVRDFKKSLKFYKTFLGKPQLGKWDASWKIGDTKLFITYPYKKKAKAFDKHNIGLNHLAFGVRSLLELKKFERMLDKAKLRHSGIQIDTYSDKEFIWFDDPDKVRLEFYFRPLR